MHPTRLTTLLCALLLAACEVEAVEPTTDAHDAAAGDAASKLDAGDSGGPADPCAQRWLEDEQCVMDLECFGCQPTLDEALEDLRVRCVNGSGNLSLTTLHRCERLVAIDGAMGYLGGAVCVYDTSTGAVLHARAVQPEIQQYCREQTGTGSNHVRSPDYETCNAAAEEDPCSTLTDRCAASDPTGSEGSTVLEGCPCTRAEDSFVCCPGSEDSFQCADGKWLHWLDGCNPPPCSDDDDAGACPEILFTHVSCPWP